VSFPEERAPPRRAPAARRMAPRRSPFSFPPSSPLFPPFRTSSCSAVPSARSRNAAAGSGRQYPMQLLQVLSAARSFAAAPPSVQLELLRGPPSPALGSVGDGSGRGGTSGCTVGVEGNCAASGVPSARTAGSSGSLLRGVVTTGGVTETLIGALSHAGPLEDTGWRTTGGKSGRASASTAATWTARAKLAIAAACARSCQLHGTGAPKLISGSADRLSDASNGFSCLGSFSKSPEAGGPGVIPARAENIASGQGRTC
jgi:hypothetical protein